MKCGAVGLWMFSKWPHRWNIHTSTFETLESISIWRLSVEIIQVFGIIEPPAKVTAWEKLLLEEEKLQRKWTFGEKTEEEQDSTKSILEEIAGIEYKKETDLLSLFRYLVQNFDLQNNQRFTNLWNADCINFEVDSMAGETGKMEERKGKKTTPEGLKFLTSSPPRVSDNNELFERKWK